MAAKRDKRTRAKGRLESGGFLALPHAVIASPAYLGLSAHAIKLLIDIGAQFRGSNNGDLCASWSVMRLRGWRSRDTLHRALQELLRVKLIELTRQGGLHRPSLFAVTWRAIDECSGKLDVPPTRVASGLWRGDVIANTVAVSHQHASRVSCASDTHKSTRQAC
jgi:hypothetical protein